jgi:hypothetical protein
LPLSRRVSATGAGTQRNPDIPPVGRGKAVAAFLLDQRWLPLNYCGIAKECLASSAAHHR